MKTLWTGGVKGEDEKKEIKLSYNASGVTRKRLSDIIDVKTKEAEKASISKDGYACPNWAYKQSDLVGYKRAMAEIQSLLK